MDKGIKPEQMVFKLFRNPFDDYPNIVYLFHDINYSGDQIKKMINSFCKENYTNGIRELELILNRPRFISNKDLKEESDDLRIFRINVLQYMATYSSIFNIRVNYKE